MTAVTISLADITDVAVYEGHSKSS